jgi:hypothetical protein
LTISGAHSPNRQSINGADSTAPARTANGKLSSKYWSAQCRAPWVRSRRDRGVDRSGEHRDKHGVEPSGPNPF